MINENLKYNVSITKDKIVLKLSKGQTESFCYAAIRVSKNDFSVSEIRKQGRVRMYLTESDDGEEAFKVANMILLEYSGQEDPFFEKILEETESRIKRVHLLKSAKIKNDPIKPKEPDDESDEIADIFSDIIRNEFPEIGFDDRLPKNVIFRIGFINPNIENYQGEGIANDETEFEAESIEDLADLFREFCKENGFSLNSDIKYIEII